MKPAFPRYYHESVWLSVSAIVLSLSPENKAKRILISFPRIWVQAIGHCSYMWFPHPTPSYPEIPHKNWHSSRKCAVDPRAPDIWQFLLPDAIHRPSPVQFCKNLLPPNPQADSHHANANFKYVFLSFLARRSQILSCTALARSGSWAKGKCKSAISQSPAQLSAKLSDKVGVAIRLEPPQEPVTSDMPWTAPEEVPLGRDQAGTQVFLEGWDRGVEGAGSRARWLHERWKCGAAPTCRTWNIVIIDKPTHKPCPWSTATI